MNVIRTEIPDLLIFEPRVFEDERGWFMESFNQKVFDEAVGHHVEFVQDNHSTSKRGVLRGLHYQLPPFAQGKLVRVTQGAVWDVAVDIRKSSPTFKRWVGVELSETNKRQFWMPPGFAHGFICLSESAQFLYKASAPYNKQSERCIIWNDTQLNVAWPITMTGSTSPNLSPKDEAGSAITVADVFA